MVPAAGARSNLALATIAFAVSFALWGLLAGLAPLFRVELGLTATETSLAVAIPVLLGSLGRIPMGILADRWGGRAVFAALLLFGALPAAALALNRSYGQLLFWGFWLGLAGTSFAIGVSFVSRWFPPERQGTALGIYGAGNMGQSVSVFLAPLLAQRIGVPATFLAFGLASAAWGAVFLGCARDACGPSRPLSFRASARVLREEPLCWLLSLFYFLTFGGFVALGIYLPTLLSDLFRLTPEDAGARTAGFVVLATLARPVGGWLADRFGGVRVLAAVFAGIAAIAWWMAIPSMVPFTAGALGCAVLLGAGNGGVFKLVGELFPGRTGAVSGLVGASGGIGGFFPPLVLGTLRDVTGSYAGGFLLLSGFSLLCLGGVRKIKIEPARAGTGRGAMVASPPAPRVGPALPAATDDPASLAPTRGE